MNKFRNIPLWVIIITIIFMWPIGIVLLILKYASKEEKKYEEVRNNVTNNIKILREKNDKLEKIKSKSKKYFKLSVFQIVLAIICFVSMVSDLIEGDTDNLDGALIINVIVIGILVVFCLKYKRLKNLSNKIETYQNLILIRDMYDVKRISTYLSCSTSEVLDFVSYMIREGYLDLDIKNENIVQPEEYIDPAKVFSIVCDNCGALNKYVKGKENKCEYCGTILNFEKI